MRVTHKPTELLFIASLAELSGVQFYEVDSVWNEVKPFVEKALQYNPGNFNSDDILRFIKNRDMQLWIISDGNIIGAGVTQIISYPRKKICLILLLSGNDFESWKHLLKDLIPWAKSNQCSALELQGRPGWERKLKWEKTAIIMRKEL